MSGQVFSSLSSMFVGSPAVHLAKSECPMILVQLSPDTTVYGLNGRPSQYLLAGVGGVGGVGAGFGVGGTGVGTTGGQ